jgi:hypothetical protein
MVIGSVRLSKAPSIGEVEPAKSSRSMVAARRQKTCKSTPEKQQV